MGFRRGTELRISIKVVKNRSNVFDLRNPEEKNPCNYEFLHQGLIFRKRDFAEDAWEFLLYRTPVSKVFNVLKEIGD